MIAANIMEIGCATAVMPAYNAWGILEATYDEVLAQGIVDLVVAERSRAQASAVASNFRWHKWCGGSPHYVS